MDRDQLVAYLDEYLHIETFDDSSNNGLQVEGGDEVDRLALAVDASLASIEGTIAAQAQMLLVHHGLFWGQPILVTGPHRRRLERLLAAGVSLYAAHLPLDCHPQVGNNATLARWLGLQEVAPFGDYKGHQIGVAGRLTAPLALAEFVAQVEGALGETVIKVWPFGSDSVQRVAIVSGSAASLLDQVAALGVDVYLTGEVSHSAYHQARELGLNVLFAGHYATETAGLKALAERLNQRFGLEAVFLDLPTGA